MLTEAEKIIKRVFETSEKIPNGATYESFSSESPDRKEFADAWTEMRDYYEVNDLKNKQ